MIDCARCKVLIGREQSSPLDPGLWRDLETHCQDCAVCRRQAVADLKIVETGDPRATEKLILAQLDDPRARPLPPDGEPLPGRGLDECIAIAPQLADRISLLAFLLDAVDCVAVAHQKRIVHRVLAPEVIRLGPTGAMVFDWTMAKDTMSPRTPPFASAVGTLPYLAPEQALGGPADARSDVYSLAAIFYYVLTGSPPYTPADASGATVAEMLGQIVRRPPVALMQRLTSLPKELAATLDQAMARDPDRRHPTARHLHAALLRLVGTPSPSAEL